MKKSTWIIKFGIVLGGLSVLLYLIHYFIFKDIHHIAIFFVEDIAFIPIEVLLVSLIIHKSLEKKEKEHILEKLNMLIGVFFNEVGIAILEFFAASDFSGDVSNIFQDIDQWEDIEFNKNIKLIEKHEFQVNMDKINISELANLLKSKREFLQGLLQNPSLLEHETFTELLRTVFHLEDELYHHMNYDELKQEDIDHLKIDIERVYPLVIYEYMTYMKYLKNNYPYLFSIETRYNPFKK